MNVLHALADVRAGLARFFNPMFESGFALHKIRAAAYRRVSVKQLILRMA